MNDEFIHNITTMCGEAGRAWLGNLPSIIQEYEQRWNFRAGPPFQLSYNYVAPADLPDGGGAVLKIGFPGNPEFRSELEALRQFDSQVIVRLLECDPENGVILLERIIPGTPLDQWGDDEQQTRVAAGRTGAAGSSKSWPKVHSTNCNPSPTGSPTSAAAWRSQGAADKPDGQRSGEVGAGVPQDEVVPLCDTTLFTVQAGTDNKDEPYYQLSEWRSVRAPLLEADGMADRAAAFVGITT
jgi:hypothetical protein